MTALGMKNNDAIRAGSRFITGWVDHQAVNSRENFSQAIVVVMKVGNAIVWRLTSNGNKRWNSNGEVL